MIFGSLAFAALVASAWIAHRIVPAAWRTPVLVVASYVFYISVTPSHALVLLAVTVLAWAVARKIDASDSPLAWLRGGLFLLVSVLIVFKYTDMAIGTFDAIAKRVGVPTLPAPAFLAPLGLSFVTFMLVSYLVEVYRGARAASLVELTLFASFFPTVLSGPIKRWAPFRDDLAVNRLATAEDISSGLARILVGAVKKFVFADALSSAIGPLQKPDGFGSLSLLLAVYALAWWIYLDFSGYSDMAIGISRLFGFNIAENFSFPYFQQNLSKFWGHWHMTLTRFFTDYVFIPLGGSRRGRARTAFNTMTVMTLSGLWHGPAWHFVIWGMAHGAGLVVARWWREAVGLVAHRSTRFAAVLGSPPVAAGARVTGTAVTFNFVAFAWLLFFLPADGAVAVYVALLKGVYRVARQLAGVA